MMNTSVIICIECSHKRGMGHYYRQQNVIHELEQNGINCVLLLNDDVKTLELIKNNSQTYEVVDLWNDHSNWESGIIAKYQAKLWINDRMDTVEQHVCNVKSSHIPVITFDDCGSGGAVSDVNIAPMTFMPLGKNALQSADYLILNKEIDKYRRLRNKLEKVIVTLGGSDTYGVTLRVVEILKSLGKTATVVCGASFEHTEALYKLCENDFAVLLSVPSLIEELSKYDLAITGGGITAFECASLGLPNIIIANEAHEIAIGKYLHNIGASIFAGYHTNIDQTIFERNLDIKSMSECGINNIKTNGLENVIKIIMERIK